MIPHEPGGKGVQIYKHCAYIICVLVPKESQIKSQFAAIKKARAVAASMGVASGSGADGGNSQANITDAEVSQISSMADRMEVDEDEIDAIVEAVQIEEYENNVNIAQG